MFEVVKAEGILGTVACHHLLCLREGPCVPPVSQCCPISLPCTRVLSILENFCWPFLLVLKCPYRESP